MRRPTAWGDGVIAMCPHQGAITGQDQQRNKSEGDAEAQHHLAQYQNFRGVEAHGDHHEGGSHGDGSAQPEREW